jgi:hypothetical protein
MAFASARHKAPREREETEGKAAADIAGDLEKGTRRSLAARRDKKGTKAELRFSL